MQRRTWSAIFLGGTLGAILGLAVVALAAARVIGSGIDTIVVEGEPSRATFLVTQAGMYTLIVAASAMGGVIVALIGYGAGTMADPANERFTMGPLAVIGGLAGAVVGFAAARTAIGVGGSIADGIVSLSVFRAAIVALVTGAITGIAIGGTVERIGRPEVLGFEGAAWPSNPVAFVRDAMAAMGLPTLAILSALGIVFALSRVLLESESTAALVLFGGIAALVLFGAAAIAARGGSGSN